MSAVLLIAVAALSAQPTAAPPPAAGDGLLLVANKTDRTLGIIDAATGRQLAAVPETGATGHEVIASADGKVAFVPIYGDSGVGRAGTDGRDMMVIDLASRKPIGSVDFGRGVRPHCPIIGPKNGLLYVTTELDQTISIIDPKTLKIVGTIPTGQPESHMLTISKDGKRGYTANVGPGTVSVLDMDAKKTVTVIPVSSAKTQRIALSVDDKWTFTADQGQPRIALISTATNTIEHWVTLPGIGFGTAPTADGKWLLVVMSTSNKVAVVNLQTRTVERTIDVPAAPQEVVIRPDGEIAYVSCDTSAKIAAIRTSDWAIDSLIDAGKGADGLAWAAQK